MKDANPPINAMTRTVLKVRPGIWEAEERLLAGCSKCFLTFVILVNNLKADQGCHNWDETENGCR